MAQHHHGEDGLPLAKFCAVALVPVFFVGQATAQALNEGEETARQCLACHGATGISAKQDVPHLAGQLSRYTLNQLRHYASGRRSDPTMQALAKAMSLRDMQSLSAYYARQSMLPTGFQADPSKVERGRRKFSEANCTYCHRGN